MDYQNNSFDPNVPITKTKRYSAYLIPPQISRSHMGRNSRYSKSNQEPSRSSLPKRAIVNLSNNLKL